MFIRTNVKGQWKTVEITDEEMRKIKDQTYKDNKAIVEFINKDTDDSIPMELKVALANTLMRHVHYNAEEYAIQKELGGKSGSPSVL